MTQAERVNALTPDEILKQKAYRSLNSPRLKPTPDLTLPTKPVNQDELDEARLIFEYEQQLQAKKDKRGY